MTGNQISDQIFDEPSIHDMVRIVLRHKRKVMLFMAVVLFFTAVVVVILPAKFESSAKLLILVGRESVTLDPVVSTGKVLNIEASREVEMNTVQELMNSRETLTQVVKKLGADAVLQAPENPGVYDYTSKFITGTVTGLKSQIKRLFVSKPPEVIEGLAASDIPSAREEEAIEVLQNSISTYKEKLSSVISITGEARSPAKAQLMVSALVDVYIQEHAKLHSTGKSEDFFLGEKQLVENQLFEKRKRLSDLKAEMGIGEITAEFTRLQADKASIAILRGSLSRDIAGTEARCELLQEMVDAEEAVVLTERSEGVANAATDGIRQQLYTLEVAESNAVKVYTENHPTRKLLSDQLEELRRIYKEEKGDRSLARYGTNTKRIALELELQKQRSLLAGLKAQELTVGKQWDFTMDSLKKLNSMSREVDQLTQDVAFLARSYDTYADSLEQSRIGRSLKSQKISNINVAQPASFVREPTGPKRALLAFGGGLFALLGAIPLAFLIEYLDGRVKSPGEVELVTGVPVMGSIPRQHSPLPVPQLSGESDHVR